MAGKGGGKADKKADAGGAEGDAKKGGGGVAGMAILAVGALASSFATVYVLTPSKAPAASTEACLPGDHVAVVEPSFDPNQAYVEMEDLVVTIGSSPATRYLKLKVSVITSARDAGKVEQAEPVLVDAFTNYLRSVELADFENPSFYAHMREQLGRRSELVLGSGVSDGVLITEFLLR